MLSCVVFEAKRGPSTEPCETLYDSVTLSVRVSVIVITRPTKLVWGINVTLDVRPPPVCISFPEQISETHRLFFHIAHTYSLGIIQAPFGVYKL